MYVLWAKLKTFSPGASYRVTTGRKLGNLIEITGGVKEGDRVISKAEDRIKNGTKVSLGQK